MEGAVGGVVLVAKRIVRAGSSPRPQGRARLNPREGIIFGINPMDQRIETRLGNLRRAPRCLAQTRAGNPCQRPALRGRKRCRLHGGLSPGAPKGMGNGNYKNGTWTAEAVEERRWIRSLASAFAKKGLET
jgi:hypothetical protein